MLKAKVFGGTAWRRLCLNTFWMLPSTCPHGKIQLHTFWMLPSSCPSAKHYKHVKLNQTNAAKKSIRTKKITKSEAEMYTILLHPFHTFCIAKVHNSTQHVHKAEQKKHMCTIDMSVHHEEEHPLFLPCRICVTSELMLVCPDIARTIYDGHALLCAFVS